MHQNVAFLSAEELGAAYRSGALTPLDVCRSALERLTMLEPKLNAFIDAMRENVLEQARVATEELKAGIDKGPLHGIPIAIKDIIDVAGVATGYATKAVAPRIAEEDADCVTLLREAGAIIFGKTNLLEFAYGVVHPDFGQTNNPLDTARTAGGSSGGSAAAVAAGIVPLALGTDTGGSVRAPASYCGIVGFKPSFDALSLKGVFPLSRSLDHLGLLARNVGDAALGFSILSRIAGDQLGPATKAGTLRLGIVEAQWNHPAIQPGVREILDEAHGRLAAAGVQFFPVELPEPQAMAETLLDILLPEAAHVHQEVYAKNPDGYAPGTREQIRAGLTQSATRYFKAKQLQQLWYTELASISAGVDAILTPTIPFVAPATDPALSAEGDDEILFLSHANLTGAACISLHCGFSEALPVGLQLTTASGRDWQLLGVANQLERYLPLNQACRELLK